MNKIVIIGHGGFGREVKMLIDQINHKTQTYDLLGFYDDNEDSPSIIHGLKYLGKVNELSFIKSELNVVYGIGSPTVKEQLHKLLISNPNLYYPNLVHPSVIIGQDNVKMGIGNILCAGSIVTVDVSIGNFNTINLMCSVGHDTIIGDFCSLMPSVNVSGEVILEDKVYLGTGCKVINQVKIGACSTIGAGAVVTRDIPSHCTAVGVPARPLKS